MKRNVKAVQRMLRHAKVSMTLTLDSYADAFDVDLDALVSAVDRELDAPAAAQLVGSAC